ncbi:MAG TPA: hypothetical protein VN775_11960 [Opitutaceae bacterium]|nr:hypothetical protein [Opitutaceae bacterium]
MKLGSRAVPWVGTGIFAGIVLITLGWAAYTHHVWEDFYITYRSGKNLALGNGLVFTVGERLQTFTSPLQALLPAAIAWLTHCRSDELVIWIYRVVGACALGATGAILWGLSRHCAWPAAATAACVGLFAFDAKSIDFTANGMETPYLLVFLGWQAYLVISGGSTLWLGVAWAGMMWSRPDAFIQIAAFYGAVLVFAADWGSRRDLAVRAIRAGAVAAVLYLPWFLWAYWYYGTPVPHTITAKAIGVESGLGPVLRAILRAPQQIITYGVFHRVLFAPTNIEVAPWDEWGLAANSLWRLLALPVWFYWINPWGGRWARTTSLWLFLGSIYYICAPGAPWYVPPYALVAMICWGFVICDVANLLGADAGAARMPAAAVLRPLLRYGVLGVVAFQLGTSLLMANAMRLQQVIIEDGSRRAIGVWLRQNAAPGDTVFLESLGYIGYFSNLKMLDFPGLASTEVVAARRKVGMDEFDALIQEVDPVWLVLRPKEAARASSRAPGLLSSGAHGKYRLTRMYDQSARVSAMGDMPGRSLLEYDQTFLVYRRTH